MLAEPFKEYVTRLRDTANPQPSRLHGQQYKKPPYQLSHEDSSE